MHCHAGAPKPGKMLFGDAQKMAQELIAGVKTL